MKLWNYLIKETLEIDDDPEVANALRVILTYGNLSKRILVALGEKPSKHRIKQIYHQLAICLQQGGMFIPD
ncbi:hypothetical protein GCM10028895_08970 [Pontibacter rugosus]